jgi:LysM repeat protein
LESDILIITLLFYLKKGVVDMTANEKRKALVSAMLTRKGKNQYSQDSVKRYMIESGYGDCSSTMRHWYKKILGIDIGLNTEAQIKSKLGKVVEMKITNGIPDESKMKLGDCLYFRGKDDNRYLGTGHVEIYIGNGKCFGHGSGVGGTEKNIKTYCTTRQNTKSTAKLKNTGLISVVRFIEDIKVEAPIETNKDVAKPTTPNTDIKYSYEYYTVKKGDNLSKIAKMYNVTVNSIIKLNSIKNPNNIEIGKKLLVTTYPLYTVIKGDTLSKISQVMLGNSNRYKEIMVFNNLSNTTISIGDKLAIPLK